MKCPRFPSARRSSSTRWRRCAATLTRLRRAAAFTGTGEPDLDRIVDRLGRAELLHRLPFRPRKRWGLALQVLVDRSRRLIPYWTDQELVAEDLQRLYPRDRLEIAVLPEGASEPWLYLRGHDSTDYRMPEPGAHVLVLGDLGCLRATRSRRLHTGWNGAAAFATTATVPWRSFPATPTAVRRTWPKSGPSFRGSNPRGRRQDRCKRRVWSITS